MPSPQARQIYVGTALICIEGLRREPVGIGQEREEFVGTALICIEGLRQVGVVAAFHDGLEHRRNCPDLY